jgi:hypothetical protein
LGIRSFVKDTKGRIFYAGLDFGYLEADPRGETRAVSLLHLIPEELRSGLVIMSMHFLDGQILIQSPGHIFRLELAEDLALTSLKSWSTETRFSFSFVNEGKYYIQQAERGLFSLEGENVNMIPHTEIFGKDLLNVVLPYEMDGKKFLLLGGRDTGFYLFEGGNLKKIPTEIDPLIQEGNSLYSAKPHQGNYILSFLGAGIVIMNPKGEIIKRIGSDQGLPSDVVVGTYFDQNEGLWALTEDGMARIAINSPILSFGKDLGISSAVLSIQKKGEELYLGTNTGLVKFERKDNQFRPVAQIDNYALNNLWADGEDLILPGRQLQLLRGGKAIRLDGPKEGGRLFTVLIPKNNPNLLLVGATNGLLVYQRGLSKEYPWEYRGKVPGIETIGSHFFEDKDGTVFTGGGEKMYMLNPEEIGMETDDPTRIKVNAFQADLNVSFSIVDGEFYKTSPEGMQKYSSKDGGFVPADELSLVEKDMYDFFQQKTGLLWYVSLDKKSISSSGMLPENLSRTKDQFTCPLSVSS